MSKFKLVLLAGVALIPCLALAEEAPVDLPTVDIVAVKARADLDPESPTNPMRLTRSSAGHTEKITRTEIEALRPRDVFDLVNNAGSVIRTEGSRKGFSGLMIRGDTNFIWIVDGAYLQPTMASRIMRNLPVNIIEEVTVVRGASALTLAPMVGSASPGGAPVDGFVVVRTRKPASRQAEARMAVESYRSIQSSFWAGDTFNYSDGKGYIAGSSAYSKSDGSGKLLNSGVPYNNGFNTLNGLAKAGYSKDDWSLDLTAYMDGGRFEIPNTNNHGPGKGSWYVSPSETVMVIASGSKIWSPSQTTLFNISHVESRQTLWTANTPAGPYASVENLNFQNHINLRHNIDFESWRVALGGDFRHWNAPNGQQYYEGIQREENTYGVFAQIEKRFFNDRLTVDAAVRFDRVHVLHGLDYFTGGAQPPGATNSPLKTTDVVLPLAKTYELGGTWRVTDQWKLLGRVGIAQQGVDGIQARPGVTLSDDSQFKSELGIEGALSRWLNPGINYFHRSVENEKSLYGYTYTTTGNVAKTCFTGPYTGANSANISKPMTPCYDQKNTTREGVEFTASGQLWEGGSYKANFTHFTNLKNAAAITPRNMAGLSIQQQLGEFLLTGAVKHVAGYKGSATDTGKFLGGYTSIDAGLSRDFTLDAASLRATLYGRNLTDVHYETSNGVQNVGRIFGLELLAKF